MRKSSRNSGKLVAVGGAMFIALVICALVASAVGPIVADLVSGGSGGGDSLVPTPAPDDRGYLDSLRTAVAASPEDPVGQISLARLITLGGNPAEAFDHFQKAVDLSPDNAAYRLDFGRALAAAPKNAQAAKEYQTAITLAPQSVSGRLAQESLQRLSGTPTAADASPAVP